MPHGSLCGGQFPMSASNMWKFGVEMIFENPSTGVTLTCYLATRLVLPSARQIYLFELRES